MHVGHTKPQPDVVRWALLADVVPHQWYLIPTDDVALSRAIRTDVVPHRWYLLPADVVVIRADVEPRHPAPQPLITALMTIVAHRYAVLPEGAVADECTQTPPPVHGTGCMIGM